MQRLSSNIWLWLVMSFLPLLMAQSARAEVNQKEQTIITKIKRLSEREQPATNISGLFAQSSTPSLEIIPVTGVKANPTEKGVEIILQTSKGEQLQITNSSTSNNFIADITNAQLRLPNGDGFTFRSEKPTVGITEITVTNFDAKTIRVTVIGEKSLPVVELFDGDEGLIFGVASTETATKPPETPQTEAKPATETPQQDNPIELVVTGEQDGYRVPNSSTATGTDTPILETPFSVQVIPQEIIRDQQITQVKDALSNISGVTYGGDVQGRSGNTFSIRGFTGAPVLLDGFRRFGSSGEGSSQPNFEVANLEQIEVLKGPASILYGAIEPGGLINLVSKKPKAEPFYETELQVGSRGFVRPRFDISGPLTDDGKVLYRLNGLFQNFNSFQNYEQPDQRYFIAPTIAWKINDRTDLNISLEYANSTRPAIFGIPAVGKGVADVPRDRIITEPSDTVTNITTNIGYTLEHRFDANWKLRNAFRYTSYEYDFGVVALPLFFDEATSTVGRFLASQESQNKDYTFQTNVTGKFATGDIKHTLLAGIDYVYRDSRIFSAVDFTFRPLNLFNPTYGLVKPSEDTLLGFGGSTTTGNSWGFYLQDQISILKNLQLLAGIRYDTLSLNTVNIPGSSTLAGESATNATAFTPRFGLLYQLSDRLSLYGSYSQSFAPNTATTVTGEVLPPQRGKGYEFGIKSEFLNGKLFATLAYFDVTKQNIAVTDPNFPLFSIASGEQRSRGFEFDLSGEILPGWKIIASYANINGEVTADTNGANIGNKLFGLPENSASLWTTYEIQQGDLQGLGLGLGFNYVGDRQGDLENSFSLGSYFTTNAAIFYKRDKWRIGLNFRNIGDVKYIESAFGGRGASNNFGDPFTVIGSISVQF
ncbi:TonB-dependent siderophore receptor [Calothrix sp. PCC 7507]|uniref:TonB-dependent siderophore receptor n=1 Tax=Calothrix sp. PCC 7507 TaxID=99598 RepID=UPI0002DD70ED|nr:TonB-dependent siderophore receptor [Calothrix sp. PCC 7507]